MSWKETDGEAMQFRALDLAQAMDRVGGDEDLLREIAALFLEDGPRMMGEVEEALRNGDATALASAAHGLKGCVATFGAKPAYEAALALETAGRNKDLSRAAQDLVRLELAIGALTPELSSIAGS